MYQSTVRVYGQEHLHLIANICREVERCGESVILLKFMSNDLLLLSGVMLEVNNCDIDGIKKTIKTVLWIILMFLCVSAT